MRRIGDEFLPLLVGIGLAALRDVLLFRQALGDDDVRDRIDDRDVRARPQLQVIVGLDVRRAHQGDVARIERR